MSIEYSFVNVGRKNEVMQLRKAVEQLGTQCLETLEKFKAEHPTLADDIDDIEFKVQRSEGFVPVAYIQDEHVIGVIVKGGFRWRDDNGFSSKESVEKFLLDNPDYVIEDEYGGTISMNDFFSLF